MKTRKIPLLLAIVLSVCLLIGIAAPLALADGIGGPKEAGGVTVTVMNPLGEITPRQNRPLAERLSTLKGKDVALVYYAKAQNPHAVRAIGEMLEAEFGITAALYNLGSAEGAETLETYEALASHDAVVIGVADCALSAWWAAYHAMMVEQLGTPAVVLTHAAYEKTVDVGAVDSGFTSLRKAVIDPGIYSAGYLMMSANSNTDFLRNTGFVKTTERTPVSVYEQVKAALTSPLTDAEKNPPEITAQMLLGWAADNGYDPAAKSFTITAESEEKASLQFNALASQLGIGDGLPLVMPTQKLVDEMLAATTRDKDDILGQIMPRGGLITVEKAAINSVMAGARPEYFPVILAALEAYASSWEEGNLLYHSLTSSENYTMMLIVSGPIVEELNLSGQWGYLGSGNEANNGIGRAFRMCVRNIGVNRPGETDGGARAGRQNDFALTVFGEEPKLLPEGWEGQNEMLGFTAEQSAVTLHGYYAPTMYWAYGGVNAAFDPMQILKSVRNPGETSLGVVTIPRNVADLARSQHGIENKAALLDYLQKVSMVGGSLRSRYLLWPVIVGDPDSARLYKGDGTFYGVSAFQNRLITGATLTENGSDATTPGAPQGFTVVRDGDKAILTWKAPASDGGSPITGYQVSCTGGAASGAWNPGGTVTVRETGIAPPRAAEGSAIPTTPESLPAVTRSGDPAWVNVPDGSMTYTFEGLDPDADYDFEVRALNGVMNAVQVTQADGSYVLDTSAGGHGAWAGE